MPFIQAYCPKCHKELSVPDDLETIICNYCGEQFKLRKIDKAAIDSVDSKTEVDAAYRLIDNDELLCANPDDEVFTRNTYSPSFDKYLSQIKLPLDHLFLAADRIGEQGQIDSLMQEFAQHIVDEIGKRIHKSKSIDPITLYTRHMIAFVVPSILRYEINYSNMLAQYIVDTWNSKYPKNPIRQTTFEQMDSGFSRTLKWCYITTAVCSCMDKPDNCGELTAFRRFRDTWLSKQDFGLSAIYDYYLTAPSIVEAIDQSRDKASEYNRIWDNYLSGCYGMILNGDNTGCYNKYKNMVFDLKKRWLS